MSSQPADEDVQALCKPRYCPAKWMETFTSLESKNYLHVENGFVV